MYTLYTHTSTKCIELITKNTETFGKSQAS